MKTLEAEQILLDKEKSLEFYHTMEENMDKYFLDCGKICFLREVKGYE